jgi:predicted RNA-binding protein with PUA-like domain
MAYWLFKSEPGSWSWDDQVRRGNKGQEWDGVRNFQAQSNMRKMRKGDRGFFYHTGDEKAVVGIVEVSGEIHPESKDPEWECVDILAVEPLPRPVSLAEIKSDPALKDMVLVRNARLSVQPVTDAEWKLVLKRAGAKA